MQDASAGTDTLLVRPLPLPTRADPTPAKQQHCCSTHATMACVACMRGSLRAALHVSHRALRYLLAPPCPHRADLINALNSSTARFKVVVGHHPVRSYGQHCYGSLGDKGDCEDLDWMHTACEKYKVGCACWLQGG